MTGEEKTALASFLDLSLDFISGGFRGKRSEFVYTNDNNENTGEIAVNTNETAINTSDTEDRKRQLDELAAEISSCTRCGLCNTRTNTVPGEGVIQPLVMVIGEGPGEDEDVSGKPFVGRAGQLLDRMLDSRGIIGLSRNTNCYIANILKCRPPGNRSPQQDEIISCIPFLVNQIKILRPKIILAAGNTAAKTLLDSTEGITKLRGTLTYFRGTLLMEGDFYIPLLPTFHPSALLRDESLKGPVWKDMQTLKAILKELDREYAARNE